MARSLIWDELDVPIDEVSGNVYWNPAGKDDDTGQKDLDAVYYKLAGGQKKLVWQKSIEINIDDNTAYTNVSTLIALNNPTGIKHVVIKVLPTFRVGKIVFGDDIPTNMTVDFFNFGEIVGSSGTYDVSGGDAIEIYRPVTVINYGFIRGGGGAGGRGGRGGDEGDGLGGILQGGLGGLGGTGAGFENPTDDIIGDSGLPGQIQGLFAAGDGGNGGSGGWYGIVGDVGFSGEEGSHGGANNINEGKDLGRSAGGAAIIGYNSYATPASYLGPLTSIEGVIT